MGVADSAPVALSTAATGRTPGYDVARAIALLGMVLVNFHGMAGQEEAQSPLFDTFLNELEGRAAALFVVLAGAGVSLRARKTRSAGATAIAAERQALLRRAAALFGIGLLNVHLWDWDILHVYGLYLTVAAGLFAASNRFLLGVAALVCGAAVSLQWTFHTPVEPDFWTVGGLFQSVMFTGNYPALPWLCFLIVGMMLGRHDLRAPGLRRRLLAVALGVVVLAEAVSAVAQRLVEQAHDDVWMVAWLSTWPRPSGPLFVLSSGAVAVAVIALCIEWSEARANRRLILALTATGQLALTLYFAHEVAILVPLQHDVLLFAPAELVAAYGLLFFLSGVAAATWWRRRNRQGPLEAILRQLSARAEPAWGGGLMENP